MIIDIMDVDKMVKANSLKPVSSSLFFDQSGVPNPEGLFSYDIFGFPGSDDRRAQPAYIQLDGHYLNPHVYKVLIRLNRSLAELISGEAYFYFDKTKNQLVKTESDIPGMGTGLEFLYEIWDKLDLRETDSKTRSNRVNLISKMPREQAFMDKQFVIPAFYRDAIGTQKVPEINGMYRKIITSVNTINTMGKIGFTYNITRSSIQNTINQIYAHFTGLLELKHGFLHKSVMSKNIDYGIRSLITAPTFSADSWRDLPADFEHASVPLTQVLGLFIVFIQAWVDSWINTKVGGKANMMVYDQSIKKIERLEIDPKWAEDYTPDNIEKQIKLFIKTPESRFYPVTLKFKDGTRKPFIFISGDRDLILDSGSIDINKLDNIRYLTWTDLFYMAAFDIASDKHVLITRYPVTNPHSEYMAGVKVRSTFKTTEMLIENQIYKQYPVINLSLPASKIEKEFIDSLEIFTPYIGPLGADHDGDQTSVRGLFTKEANDFAKKHIRSISNIVGSDGKSLRTGEDVATHTMYNLLRDPDE